jgi:anti-sigma regulatory factor (Ser/Thr protein kinase)
MSIATTATRPPRSDGFRHEALLYAGPDEFLQGTGSFIREGLEGGEPTLVVVSAAKIDLLRHEFAAAADRVRFADMAQIGMNPARIIPAWRAFLDEQPGEVRRVRGIGEPIWDGRSPAELVECQRHESLLNVAFEAGPGWSLLCPYDTATLDPATIDEARSSHPYVRADGLARISTNYRGTEAAAARFDQPLPEPPVRPFELAFGARRLGTVRDVVARLATDAGFSASRTADLVVVVNELTTNSLLHARGGGVLRVWREADGLICEVRDDGHLDQPLAGRERPTPDQEHGRGLWVANQLCELVQVRSFATGTVVRAHMRRGYRHRDPRHRSTGAEPPLEHQRARGVSGGVRRAGGAAPARVDRPGS